MAIITIACSFLLVTTEPRKPMAGNLPVTKIELQEWEAQAVQWLVEAQGTNGGWGAGSHNYQNIRDPHAVDTDPATTAFAALALMKSGGRLEDNPNEVAIRKALQRILQDIEQRTDNGRITTLTSTQPQAKLGIHIDASMALQFLTEIREEINDPALASKIDAAAGVCIRLLQESQNEDGGWAGGGWAPVLQSAMANNALEVASDRYKVEKKVLDNSRQYQAENIAAGGVRSDDGAGVPLYVVASAQRATAEEAREADTLLDEVIIQERRDNMTEKELSQAMTKMGISPEKAGSLAKSYKTNQEATRQLQNESIWEGFGNNGGEEYLSFMITSDSLIHHDKTQWQ